MNLQPDNRWGWPAVRFEFGPWWWRLWLVLRHGGKRHHIWNGEPCVVFRAERDDSCADAGPFGWWCWRRPSMT